MIRYCYWSVTPPVTPYLLNWSGVPPNLTTPLIIFTLVKSITDMRKLKHFSEKNNMAPKSSRVKSCKPCRLAKARCSLGQPCSRCASRQVECRYVSEAMSARTTSTYRRLEPVPMVMPDVTTDTEVEGTDSSQLASTIQVDSSNTSIFDTSETQPGTEWSAENREFILRLHPPIAAMTDDKSHRNSR
jgi:hypothetical protein